jgi:predicted nucleic acid-binding Zn ribbon protein
VTCGGDLPGVGVFCPHCGTPLVPSAMQIGTDDRPAVIERTAKKWKLMQLIGFFIALVAFIAVVLMLRAEADYATKKREPTDTHLFFRWLFSATILLGIAVGLYGRLKAWWHHG